MGLRSGVSFACVSPDPHYEYERVRKGDLIIERDMCCEGPLYDSRTNVKQLTLVLTAAALSIHSSCSNRRVVARSGACLRWENISRRDK